MRVDQWSWSEANGWNGSTSSDANLVLFFGARAALECGTRYRQLRERFPV